MKKIYLFIIAILMAALVSVIIVACSNPEVSPSNANGNVVSASVGASTNRWEYKVINLWDFSDLTAMEKRLNELGMDGWELIINGGAVGTNNGRFDSLIFKRRLS